MFRTDLCFYFEIITSFLEEYAKILDVVPVEMPHGVSFTIDLKNSYSISMIIMKVLNTAEAISKMTSNVSNVDITYTS